MEMDSNFALKWKHNLLIFAYHWVVIHFISIFAISLLSILFLNGQDHALEELRPKYMKALHDYEEAPDVYELFEAVENPSAKLLAYRGALEAIMTKTTWNIFKKLSFLSDCQDTFNEAIAMAPNNIEVRFMRLSVEHEIPYYLGFSSHMKEDKEFVVKNINQFDPLKIDPEILVEILGFVNKSGRFTNEEILLFENVFASSKKLWENKLFLA